MVLSVLDVHYFWGHGESLSYSSTETVSQICSRDEKKQGREGRKKAPKKTQER